MDGSTGAAGCSEERGGTTVGAAERGAVCGAAGEVEGRLSVVMLLLVVLMACSLATVTK